jgi:GTP-sensing pleiotropic transcriptional regulator CodY
MLQDQLARREDEQWGRDKAHQRAALRADLDMQMQHINKQRAEERARKAAEAEELTASISRHQQEQMEHMLQEQQEQQGRLWMLRWVRLSYHL